MALKRQKFPPMPVEILANHPKALGMNGAAFGHLMRLALHFWLTDCRPLPVVDNQLYVLARAYPATWKANRVEIKEVLQDVTPYLAEAMALYRKRSSLLGDMRSRAQAANRVKRLQKRNVQTTLLAEMQTPRQAEHNRAAKLPAPVEAPTRGGFTDKAK